MREAIFTDRRPAVARLARDIVVLVRDEGTGLDEERRRDAEAVIERMIAQVRLLPELRGRTRRACSCGSASTTSSSEAA